jgi:hypothetical protein
VPDRAIEVPGVGCIVDGVPPRMQLTEEDIQIQLDRRRPGQKGAGSISTGRNEDDAVQILSGAHPAPPWARAVRSAETCRLSGGSCCGCRRNAS